MKLEKRIKQANDLLNNGNLAEAKVLFQKLLQSNPREIFSLFSLGLIAMKSDDPTLALNYFDRVVKVNPNFDKAWFNRGVVLYALKRHEKSIESYDRAIKLNPAYVDALNNRGVVLQEIGRYQDAINNYDQLLGIVPTYDKALANKGFILILILRYDEAIACFTKLLEVNPEYNFALGMMSSAQQYACKWDDFERIANLICEGVRAGKCVSNSLVLMAVSDSASDQLLCAQSFARLRCPPAADKMWNGEVYNHSKIRIAYISPDFREHPVSHLMVGILEHHDKSRFEIYGFFLGMADNSSMYQRIAATFDEFFDVRQKGSKEIAEMMRAMEIDIAVDLGGYTQDARPDLLAYRPAPVQVNYLGYPGSLGVEYIDYIIADKVVIPEADHPCYSENVVYLPGSYLPTDSTLKVADRTPEREEFGLPATGFVFCSFNHAYKISPAIFEVWMRILKRTPDSVLWLMKLNSTAEINLRKEAEARGVDPARLIFATRVPKVEDHLARYRLADLFLDTTPYNAHTTACDALFVGLPVLTYLGHAFPGRVAASLLTTSGLPELIAHSLTDYEDMAVKLAHDAPLLQGLRERVAVNRETHPLFKTAEFCCNLESVYTIMWERYQQGLAPTPIREIATAESKELPVQAAPAPVQQQPVAPLVAAQPETVLGMAQNLLRQGNLPQAELYLRQSIARSGVTVSTTNLFNELRRAYGLSENFELSENIVPALDSQRFLLIKAWGYGFWSEIHHLASQLLLAELTRRTPIILWGTNCLFRNNADTNAFSHFFHEINSMQLRDVPHSASIFPRKWTWNNIYEENVNKWEGAGSRLAAQYLFARQETLLVSDFFSTISSIIPWIGRTSKYFGLSEDALYAEMFQKYLKPVDGIVASGNSFFSHHMQGRPWVGVHVRGSDKIHESPHLAATNAQYYAFVDRIVELNPAIGVFLLTDSHQVLNEFATRYGSRLLCSDVNRSASNIGVHLSGHDGIAVGAEVLFDVLIALKCNYFVGNKESNVSLAVTTMRPWPQGFVFLLGEKSIRGENMFLHKRE